MAKKAELQKEAEALGVDPSGLKVAELEVAVAAAEQATTPTASKSAGRHAAHAYGTSQGVHLELGHMVDDGSGVMVFQLASEFVIGRDEALALAEELPAAAHDNTAISVHGG
jgi:hypothetical protein